MNLKDQIDRLKAEKLKLANDETTDELKDQLEDQPIESNDFPDLYVYLRDAELIKSNYTYDKGYTLLFSNNKALIYEEIRRSSFAGIFILAIIFVSILAVFAICRVCVLKKK